jgi:hypothetical protein
MPRKSLELPPAVARNFVRDMRAFFTEKNTIKAYAIAAQQLHALREPAPVTPPLTRPDMVARALNRSYLVRLVGQPGGAALDGSR